MTLKEKLERINFIEENFPVDTLIYQGIEVWPLIRLWFFQKMSAIPKTKSTNSTKQNKKTIFQEVLFYFILFLKTFWTNLKDLKNTDFRLKKSELVYIANIERRNEIVEHKHFSKFADAMYSFLNTKYTFQILESSLDSKIPSPKYYPAFNLNFRLHSVLFLNKLKTEPKEKIKNFDEFEAFLIQSDFRKDLSITTQQVKREVNLVLGYKNVFLKVLKKIDPKIAFHTCFFSKSNFGLILAANEQGIKTVEVQHGQQGDYNNMYTSWKNIPQNGYQLLPTHYWMWGKRSANRIKLWAASTSRHKVLVGGNPWLAYVIAKNQAQKQAAITEQVNILVSLQLLNTLESSFLRDAISQSPPHYTWYIRMHPRYSDKERILRYFSTKNCQNIELEKANSMKIYDLFSQMNFHITFWSTTAYEAIAFDVPTILIHPNGKDAMANYIKQGVFKYAENTEELLQAIEKNDFKTETEKYMETDPAIIRTQIKKLLDNVY